MLNVGPRTYSFFSTGNDNFFVQCVILTACPKKQKRKKKNKCECLIHSIGLCIHTMGPPNIDFRLHCLEQNFYRNNYFKSPNSILIIYNASPNILPLCFLCKPVLRQRQIRLGRDQYSLVIEPSELSWLKKF